MLCARTDSENGGITFTPLNNENVYIHCSKCGLMEKVDYLLDFVGELGEADLESKALDICHECFEEESKREEVYLKNRK